MYTHQILKVVFYEYSNSFFSLHFDQEIISKP